MGNATKIKQEQPDPPVRGEGILRKLERIFLWLDAMVERFIPPALNPFAQTGAIANVLFIVALVSGVLLLFWYVPSVDKAWRSLEEMGWTGEWMRSVHRYSSDATIFFVLIHALKLWFSRRFVGARWLAWITGVFLLGMLWFVGWLGYWLVWDVRAQAVAVESARMLELLPIFTEPLSRMLLTNATVSTALFFTVFFFHMLLPLVMGIALWMHITRLSRPRFLTSKIMAVWVVGVTLLVSVLFPATSADAADMTLQASGYTSDWWYLLPLALTERLSAGALWAVALFGSIVFFAVPWWMSRGKPEKAVVDPKRCNACARCVKDCPYGAIVMVPRTDDHKRYELQAEVDPDKCVGCGICAGACNPGGIGLPQMPVMDVRRELDAWIDEALEGDDEAFVAFACSNSAAAEFDVGEDGTSPQLPGYRIVPVPCAGWVNAMSIERALRRGANGVLIVGCEHRDPYYREGAKWVEERLLGLREPALRRDKVDAENVRFVTCNRAELGSLMVEAQELRAEAAAEPIAEETDGSNTFRTVVAGAVLAALICVPVVLFSDMPSLVPTSEHPELVVSFKYRARAVKDCRELTEEERAKLPRHMQRDRVCERQRPDTRLRVMVDGDVLHDEVYEPKGFSDDGPAIALEHLDVQPGTHQVTVEIAPTVKGEHPVRWEGELEFRPSRRHVVSYDKGDGFIVE